MTGRRLWMAGSALLVLLVCAVGFSQNSGMDEEVTLSVVASPEAQKAEPAIQPMPQAKKPSASTPSSANVFETPALNPSVEDGVMEIGGSDVQLADQSGGMIAFSFEDRPIKEVINDFSLLSGANIIVPDLGPVVLEKKTSITLNFSINEWKDNMQAVLESQGLELYEAVPGSEVYIVRLIDPEATEPTTTQVFDLKFTSATSVEEMISRLVGETGSYTIFPERNIIIATSTEKGLREIEMALSGIDLPRQQVFIEAKFLELNDRAQRDLGINWQILEAYNVRASGMGLSYDETESFVKTDAQQRFYDVAGRTYEEGTSVVDAFPRPGTANPDFTRISGLTPTRQVDDTMTVTRDKTLSALLSADDFQLVLSALDQKNGVSLVSNPKIIVANEEEASIHLGSKEPNIKVERTEGTDENPGGTTTAGLDEELPWFEDGIKVVVKPTINTAENIMVKIVPEITTFGETKKVVSDTLELEYPTMETKKIETVFSLESGQTAAIGGLTQTGERSRRIGVPLLGRIPYLGRLFSYEYDYTEQDETIIFVTVGLANPQSIDMETGLPSKTRLALDYKIKEENELQIQKQKRNLYRLQHEQARKVEISSLQRTEQKMREKQQAELEKQQQILLDEQTQKAEQAQKELEALKASQEKVLAERAAEAERRENQLKKEQERALAELEKQKQALAKEKERAATELEKQKQALQRQQEKMEASTKKELDKLQKAKEKAVQEKQLELEREQARLQKEKQEAELKAQRELEKLQVEREAAQKAAQQKLEKEQARLQKEKQEAELKAQRELEKLQAEREAAQKAAQKKSEEELKDSANVKASGGGIVDPLRVSESRETAIKPLPALPNTPAETRSPIEDLPSVKTPAPVKNPTEEISVYNIIEQLVD